MNELQDKVAVITGATSGIGRAALEKFLAEGAKVCAVGRKDEALSELAQNPNVKTIKADVTSETDAQKIVDESIKHFGKIDVLVNAAGIISNGTLENTSLKAWDEMMLTNVRAVFHLSSRCVEHLIKSRGNIVNVSSVTGLRPYPNVLAYCVSKAAIDQMTRCSALDLAEKGVRVNAVNPGVVVTDLHKRGGMNATDYETFLDRCKLTHPLGRAGEASEIADLIVYLASERASWITGSCMPIDGGRNLMGSR